MNNLKKKTYRKDKKYTGKTETKGRYTSLEK